MLERKKTSIKGILLYECKNGFYQNRVQIFIGIGVLVFIIYMVIQDSILLNNYVNIGDCWFYLFSGSPEYIYSSDAKFELPILWFLFHTYLLYMICNYPVNDLDELGLQSMMLSKSREKWLTGKLVWAITMVCVYYILAFLVMIVEVIIKNNFLEQKIGLEFTTLIMGDKGFVPYILPLISDIAIAILQMSLSFLFNPFCAFVFSILYFILSVYFKNPFLLGNYSMFLRNISFSENGLNTEYGIAICVLYIVLCIFICMYHIHTRDIFGKSLEV